MANNPNKPINHAPARTPSDEEKQNLLKHLAVRREQYAINILTGLGSKRMFSSRHAVKVALKRADLLLEKLYAVNVGETK